MAQLAIDMDQDGSEYPLECEEAYFDGCPFMKCAI